MVTIAVPTSDSIIWEKERVVMEIHHAMSQKIPFTLDMLKEGPDLDSLGLMTILEESANKFDYDLSQITLLTGNLVQSCHDKINILRTPPWHFVHNTRLQLESKTTKKSFSKKFGIFIGRSNQYRLKLSSHLWNYFSNDTVQTFHWAPNTDFHKDNVGLHELVTTGAFNDVDNATKFLKHCPMLCDEVTGYPLVMDQHCNIFQEYHDFLIEIVCETYFSGETFFPTEKIWRPIIMCTPFIVQGPRYFLHRLKNLGFKTFDQWWDEGYTEDTGAWQTTEIIKNIDRIALTPLGTLQQWYKEMQPILDHNRDRLLSMTVNELKSLSEMGFE